jgi:hypothetical protein
LHLLLPLLLHHKLLSLAKLLRFLGENLLRLLTTELPIISRVRLLHLLLLLLLHSPPLHLHPLLKLLHLLWRNLLTLLALLKVPVISRVKLLHLLLSSTTQNAPWLI